MQQLKNGNILIMYINLLGNYQQALVLLKKSERILINELIKEES